MTTMRKLLIFASFLFTSFAGQCQTDGYKNIKIGKRLELQNLSQLYKIEQIAKKGFRLTSLTEQKFCDIAIAYIDVELNDDTSINLIQLNTVDNIYNNTDDFRNAYVKIGECIISTVGKPVHYDPGTDRKDGQMTTAWTFENKKYWLSLYGNSLSIFEHQVSRHFMIAWFQGRKQTKCGDINTS